MYRPQLTRRALAALVLSALVAGCSGGGSPPMSQPAPVPSPTSTSTSGSTSGSDTAYTCTTSDSTASVARGQFVGTKDSMHRAVSRRTTSAAATGLIAVTYSGALSATAKSLAVSRERAAGAGLVREMTFPVTGRYERILHVTPGSEARAVASLRTQSGVLAAAMTGTPRAEETVSQKYYSNDPYYNGFTETQIVTGGDTGSATYHVDPYEESASVPGQWGDQAIRLGDAEAYSQANNGSGVSNMGALGSANVKIAVIDSGEDSTHPELASKIAYQKCFITNSGGLQSTSNYSVDEDGHGTDVSGIAAAETNNNLGFVGSGGAASLYAYRVFPTPDDTCVPGYTGTVDSQCDANTIDIASAIDDAINEHVNVISLSLGGGGCSNGTDEDSTEGNAIDAAIAANIVVVAAAGNDSDDPKNPGNTGIVSAPACDKGVIAVGASALSDGVATGTTNAPAGSASSPSEYVASYSQYGSPAAAADSTSAWGIVAPGGDPSTADASPTATSTDDLHWIENIWTSTPYMASSTDTSFEGECDPDFGGASTTIDCRTLIAGTSQATPLVAGAAALIIAANPNYQSPSAMKQLLFSTAHDIGDAHEGAGRLDLYRAMATAVGDSSLPASQ
jgi:subtilisin family serine protease